MADQIELCHIINSKPILSKNAHYQLNGIFSLVFKAGASHIEGVGESLGETTAPQIQIQLICGRFRNLH